MSWPKEHRMLLDLLNKFINVKEKYNSMIESCSLNRFVLELAEVLSSP